MNIIIKSFYVQKFCKMFNQVRDLKSFYVGHKYKDKCLVLAAFKLSKTLVSGIFAKVLTHFSLTISH